jgi:hypothetical protein
MWGRITIAAVFVVLVVVWLAAIWFMFYTDLQFKWERRPQFLSEASIQERLASTVRISRRHHSPVLREMRALGPIPKADLS